MKIGTFKCWLVGHCFMSKWLQVDNGSPTGFSWQSEPVNYCVKCGIDKLSNN